MGVFDDCLVVLRYILVTPSSASLAMFRPLMRFSAIALACAPAALFGQSKFEGVLTLQLTSPQGPTEMMYSIKGDQVRMDMTGMGGMSMFMLRDGSKNSNTVVIPSQRMYMEMPQMQGGMPGQAAAAEKVASHLKMTGKKETIAGYECEHVIVSSDDGTQHDVCAAKGLGSFLMPNNPMGGRGRGAGSPAWEALGGEFFPLKVQKVGGDVVFQVTKIEKKSLDASTFSVPDGFQKMDMGGMGRMGRPPMGT